MIEDIHLVSLCVSVYQELQSFPVIFDACGGEVRRRHAAAHLLCKSSVSLDDDELDPLVTND